MNILTHWIKPKTEVITHFPEVKTVEQVIEEIHETFFTEVDRLLAEAGVKHSLETEKEEILNKGNRLKALGFSQAKLVSEAEEEQNRLDKLRHENSEKIELIEAITYFSEKYPKYKFITEESVKKISSKYNLVYGSVKNYKGGVPEKNLQDIENFSIEENDELYLERMHYRWGNFETKFITKNEIPNDKNRFLYAMDYSYSKAPFEIVAPIKDFDMTGKEVKDFKIQNIEIPDPIVLQPVIFNKRKYYLIVTAWGLEGEDELIKL